MADYTPTPEQVEAFKAAWHKADTEGRVGERVRDGLAAADAVAEPSPCDHERAARELVRISMLSPSDALALIGTVTTLVAMAEPTTLPSVEDVARIKAEALREAAEVWGDSTWSDVWLADGVDDDVSAVQSTVRWLNTRAAQVERGESDE